MSDARAKAIRPVSSSPLRLWWERFLDHRPALVSGLVLLVLAAASAGVPILEWLMGREAIQVDLSNRLAPPSLTHPLGTDEIGRDLLLRLLYGGRVSLTVGLAAAAIAAVLGTAIGLVAGYFGGWTDRILMRVTDGVISLPMLALLIVLAAIDFSKLGLGELMDSEWGSLYRIVLIIALVGWTTVARLVRAATLTVRERDFVTAARGIGASPVRIMLVHILPNVISPIIVAATLSVGNLILLESVLSFLGLGIQPPMPSWGNMLTGAQELIWDHPSLALWPGLAIFVTVIAFNFLGDGLQDASDPRAARGRR